MVTVADEQMHQPGPESDWQESFYFNWFDSHTDAMGLARVGFRPNDQTCDAIVFTIRDGRMEGGRLARGVTYRDTPDPARLVVGDLELRMAEPMSRWELQLTGRNEIDLKWTTLNPPFDFHAEAPPGVDFPPGFSDGHMEQSGRVSGRVKMRGVEYTIDGFGQRDKSWGVRHWGRIDGWDWIPVLFGPDLTMNLTQMMSQGQQFPAGYIFRDGANHAVRHVQIDYDWKSPHIPRGVQIVVTDVQGCRIEITGRTRGQACLYHRGLVVQESPAEFEAVIDGQRRTGGVGLIEHAWGGSRLEKLKAAPRFIATMGRMVR